MKYTTHKEEGTGLLRVRATHAFGNVAEGEYGGLISDERNLSQYGNAWVYGDAQVSGKVWVSGNAQVYHKAWVFGNAWVSDDAFVYGRARVFGDARLTPKVLQGFPFCVTFTDHHIRAGCQFHTVEEWRDRGAAMIKAEGHSTMTAKTWHTIIMSISDEHQKDLLG